MAYSTHWGLSYPVFRPDFLSTSVIKYCTSIKLGDSQKKKEKEQLKLIFWLLVHLPGKPRLKLWNNVQLRLMGMSWVLQYLVINQNIGQILTWWWCKMKSQEINQVFKTYTEGNIHLYTKCHGSPSNSCWEMSLRTTNVKLMVAKSGDTKVIRIHSLGNMNVCTKCHDDPSNSCWDIIVSTKVVDRQTNIDIPGKESKVLQQWPRYPDF